VFAAMKAVEVRVRQLAGFEDGSIGVGALRSTTVMALRTCNHSVAATAILSVTGLATLTVTSPTLRTLSLVTTPCLLPYHAASSPPPTMTTPGDSLRRHDHTPGA